MNMRKKILIPMVCVTVICAAIIGVMGIVVVKKFVEEFNSQQLSNSHILASTIIEEYKDNAQRAASVITDNELFVSEMKNHLNGENFEELADTCLSLMESTGVDLMLVTDTLGTVLLRGHELDNFGDSLAYQDNIKRAIAGESSTTIERGNAIKLSVKTGAPVYDEFGEIIGVVSVGYRLDNDDFVDHIKNLSKTEVSVFLGDTRIASTTLTDSGERVVGTKAPQEVSVSVLGGGEYIGRAQVQSQAGSLYADYFPLRDANDEVVGMLAVAIDTSQIDAELSQSVATMTGVIALLGIISAVISWNVASRLARPIEQMSSAAREIASGNLDVPIRKNSKDEIGELSNMFGDVVDIFALLLDRINYANTLLLEGEIDINIDEAIFPGDYKQAIHAINNTTSYLLSTTRDALNCATEYGKGNFEAKIRRFKGKQAVLHESMDELQNNLKSVNKEIRTLIDNAINGKLEIRIDIDRYSGDWRTMTDGLNHLLEAIDTPISEVSDVLFLVSNADYDVSIKGDYKGKFKEMKTAVNATVQNTAEYIYDIRDILLKMSNQELDIEINKTYKGDFIVIKDALTQIIETFNQLIGEFSASAEQVASGSNQISESSITLATGASQQASAAQQLNTTIESISQQTSKNAQNSDKASILSLHAKNNGIESKSEMERMLKAMVNIEEASSDISKIINVIDDLAFQTNMLALNAAVESARAGNAGKGFSVVAEEVKNLAGRSKKAASEIAELINSTKKIILEGTEIANATAHSLSNMVEEITEINVIIDDVSEASKQQDFAISQIKEGIGQISEVTQTNASISEESASSAQQLSSQAEVFRNALAQFSLKHS